MRRRSEQLAHARATLTGRIVDSYTNIQTVKLFAHLEREDQHARESIADHTAAFHRQTRLITFLNLTVSSGNAALLVAVGGLAVWLWSRGAVTLGDIAIATGLALRIVTMSGMVMWTSIGIFDNVGQVQEGMRTIARPHTLDDRPNARPLAAAKGAIRFENVRFHYGKAGGVIDNLSLNISAGREGRAGRAIGRRQVDLGQPVASVLRCRRRPYPHRWAGHRPRDAGEPAPANRHGYAGHVSSAPLDRGEHPLGRPDAGEAAMIHAARQAHAHGFVQALTDPDGRRGYDTMVGERGVKLSGGQRQRIAIARVLLKNAPILVLDEATSALDSEVEAAIQESLHELMDGKTVIAIAHRLSTIAAMDRLIVLDKGGSSRPGRIGNSWPATGSTQPSGDANPVGSWWRSDRDGVLGTRVPSDAGRSARTRMNVVDWPGAAAHVRASGLLQRRSKRRNGNVPSVLRIVGHARQVIAFSKMRRARALSSGGSVRGGEPI